MGNICSVHCLCHDLRTDVESHPRAAIDAADTTWNQLYSWIQFWTTRYGILYHHGSLCLGSCGHDPDERGTSCAWRRVKEEDSDGHWRPRPLRLLLQFVIVSVPFEGPWISIQLPLQLEHKPPSHVVHWNASFYAAAVSYAEIGNICDESNIEVMRHSI